MSEVTDAAQSLLARLADADVESASAAVLLRQVSEEVRLRRVDLAADAAKRMQSLAAEFRDDLVERAIIDYQYGRQLQRHEALAVSQDEVVEAKALLDALDVVENARMLDLRRRESNQARLFVTDATFVLGNIRTRVVFARGHVKNEVVSASKQTALIFRDGVYDLLDGHQLVLQDRYEVAIIGDYVLGTNTRRFEEAFHFSDRIKEESAAALEEHFSKLRIANFEELEAACRSNIGMARKAASVGRKMAVKDYADAMNMDSILDFIDDHGEDVEVTVRDGPNGREFVHEQTSASGRWAILKVLDDDYLTSELTKSFYEAPSKAKP